MDPGPERKGAEMSTTTASYEDILAEALAAAAIAPRERGIGCGRIY